MTTPTRAAVSPQPARRNLREACVGAAMAVIEREGVEGLSLREVARRLGVSHQAPYKHVPSRDHILAETACARLCRVRGPSRRTAARIRRKGGPSGDGGR